MNDNEQSFEANGADEELLRKDLTASFSLLARLIQDRGGFDLWRQYLTHEEQEIWVRVGLYQGGGIQSGLAPDDESMRTQSREYVDSLPPIFAPQTSEA